MMTERKKPGHILQMNNQAYTESREQTEGRRMRKVFILNFRCKALGHLWGLLYCR